MRALGLSAGAIVSLASVVAAAPAMAQAAPPPPVPPVVAPPGSAPTREEVNPPPPPAPPQGHRAEVNGDRAFAPGPCPLTDDVRTTIREVRFTGVGGAPLAPELARLLVGIGTTPQEQSIRVVCSLRDEAIGRLRRARYVASVQIPQQRIDDGVLRLEVVSGRIVDVRVRGDAGPYEKLLKGRIEQLRHLDPLNEADAERILLLADDVPGVNVQLGLVPAGTAPGDLIGELTVTFRRTMLIGNVQNYNSKQLGRETLYLRGEIYGLTGLGDRTFVAASATADFHEQLIGQVGHAMTLDRAGTELSLVGTVAESRPDLDTLDLRTLSLIGTAELSRPLIRRVNTNARAGVGFEYAMQRTRIYSNGDSVPLNRDRIATVYARVAGDTRKLAFDGHQIYSLNGSIELRKGLDILGATKTGKIVDNYAPTRFEGSATATVIRAQLGGTIGLGPIFELSAQGRAQWSNRPLLNYDEFSIGNLTLVRGYDPGANTGDRAIGGAFEARANIPVNSDVRAQVFGFYDVVYLRNLDTGSTEARRTIASLGGGARLTLFNSMRLDVTYAHPLDPPLLTGVNVRPPADRVLVSLTAQLIPWGATR